MDASTLQPNQPVNWIRSFGPHRNMRRRAWACGIALAIPAIVIKVSAKSVLILAEGRERRVKARELEAVNV